MQSKTEFVWNGITICMKHTPHRFTSAHHVEIESIAPKRAPLPITETGYRSHYYVDSNGALSDDEALRFVKKWMEEESQSECWKKYMEASRQFSFEF